MAVEGQVAGERRALRVQGIRTHHRQFLVQFEEFDATTARTLVGAELYASREDVALADGEYLDEDLVGCTLVGTDGATLGEVVDVAHYPAQDMLVVGARRRFVPLVSAFVRGVDLARKRIEVDLPEGLLEGD
jgi:16S rRNA processing protein RimM